MQGEIWKDVAGYEGIYQVSNMGRVKRLEKRTRTRNGYRTLKEIIVKPIVQHTGYAHIGLWGNGILKQVRLHRLIAEAFCHNPDPEKKVQVNHLNEDKLDNRACNLEWVTAKENTLHGTCLVRRGKAISATKKAKRSIFCFSLSGQFIAVFHSSADASFWACKDRNNRNIATALRGKQKTAFGYRWMYAQQGGEV